MINYPMINKEDISKNVVRWAMQNKWDLKPRIIDISLNKDWGANLTEAFEQYYLRYWAQQHLISHIQNGIIDYNGIHYSVIYHKCCYGTILALDKNSQVALSFRIPHKKYCLQPTVLIKVY